MNSMLAQHNEWLLRMQWLTFEERKLLEQIRKGEKNMVDIKSILHILKPEDYRREMSTLKELIETNKKEMQKSPLKRIAFAISDLDILFPSKKGIPDRYQESVEALIKKYVTHYNRKYCNDSVFYRVGTAYRKLDGEKVIFIQEIQKPISGAASTINPIPMEDVTDAKPSDITDTSKSYEAPGGGKLDLPEDLKEKMVPT